MKFNYYPVLREFQQLGSQKIHAHETSELFLKTIIP